jgi:aldehyde:ferredoxin oxidoreductase
MVRKIIEVDCGSRKTTEKEVPAKYRRLWGRGLTSAIVNDHVAPTAHPLGELNSLVIAPGLMAGSTLSSCNRLSAGAKSPLTGGIKESNSGGVAAYKLGRLGIRALVLKGSCRKDDFPSLGLKISNEGVSFEDLSFVKGKNTYEASKLLLEKFGKKVGLLLIGSAGERRLSSACISINDMEGEPCRNLGRGGLGAVMGSKGLKAIIIDDSDCKNPYAKNEAVKRITKDFATTLREHPVTGEKFAMYGTAMTLLNVNALGGLPTNNFSKGIFAEAERIGAPMLHETIKSRGGLTAHSCMPGCVIRCSNKYVRADGSPLVGSVDYENISLLGSNIGISDLDEVAELNYLCNDIGIDTIETGVALGVLAEAGLFSFGDYKGARRIIEEIGGGTPLGHIAASGGTTCGRVYGITRVPSVKGQGMAAYDPRAIKGLGVTYAMSPMGADHTAGNAIVLDIDHQNPRVQVDAVRDLHINTTILDILGMCFFTARVSLADPKVIEGLVEAFTGEHIGYEELREISKQTLLTEREFNRRAGLGEESERVPEFMEHEALPETGSVFDVTTEELGEFYNFF